MAFIGIFNEPNSGATLTADITAGASSFTYTGTDAFVQGSMVLIDSELILIGTVNTSTNVCSNLIRGYWPQASGGAEPHLAGAVIKGPIAPYPNAARRVSQNAVTNHYQPAFGTAEAALVYMVNAANEKAKSVNAENAMDAGRQQSADDETAYRAQAAIEIPPVS